MNPIRVGLIGDYNPEVVAHQAIPQALDYASQAIQHPVEATWIHTSQLTDDVSDQLAPYDGLWCVPASPYENFDGALAAIRFARESNRPFIGT